jgi:DNA-binding CsgD family transcriptional regulator
MTDSSDSAIQRLTRGQIDCLVLVHQHLTSKEIAPILGISPHTVDQRIRASLRTLGCDSRAKAAQMVSSQAPSAPAFKWHSADADLGDTMMRPLGQSATPVHSKRPIRLPIATKSYPVNDMSVPVRLLWIVLIASVAAFSMGIYLAGLESLTRLLNGFEA